MIQTALMDLNYAERRLIGRKIRRARSTVAIQKAKPAATTHVVVPRTDTVIMITATRGVTVPNSNKLLSYLLGAFQLNLSGKNLLWINLRETSPVYQFVYITSMANSADTRDEPILGNAIPPEWLTSTPEARF